MHLIFLRAMTIVLIAPWFMFRCNLVTIVTHLSCSSIGNNFDTGRRQ